MLIQINKDIPTLIRKKRKAEVKKLSNSYAHFVPSKLHKFHDRFVVTSKQENLHKYKSETKTLNQLIEQNKQKTFIQDKSAFLINQTYRKACSFLNEIKIANLRQVFSTRKIVIKHKNVESSKSRELKNHNKKNYFSIYNKQQLFRKQNNTSNFEIRLDRKNLKIKPKLLDFFSHTQQFQEKQKHHILKPYHKKFQTEIQKSFLLNYPDISCLSFACSNLPSKNNQILPIASLTKIMTLYLCLQILKDQDIIEIDKKDATIMGTKAYFNPGDKVSVRDMYYALMLPSGNDAAIALARKAKFTIKEFVKLMNQKSKFKNPHGLGSQNVSCATELVKLCQVCLKCQKFKKIVMAKEYRCILLDRFNKCRQKYWQNTNKLLNIPGFMGIKTGYTPIAGPCLASFYKEQGLQTVIVLLKSNSLQSRFSETIRIIEWIKQYKNKL